MKKVFSPFNEAGSEELDESRLRQVRISADFDVDDYILGVRNELRSALPGLVEECE